MAEHKQQTSTKPSMLGNKNVAGGLLSFFRQGQGYYQDGYCRSGPDDSKNYSIAATVTHGFLQSEYGDDPPYKGTSAGQKICLSAHDFARAIQELGPDTAPKVHLHATHDRALEVLSYKDLKKYAAAAEATSEAGRQDTHIDPAKGGGAVKERNELGGDQGTMAPGRGKSQNRTTDAHPGKNGGPRG